MNQFLQRAGGVAWCAILVVAGCEREPTTRPTRAARPLTAATAVARPSTTSAAPAAVADAPAARPQPRAPEPAADEAKPDRDDPPTPTAKRLGKNVYFERLPGDRRRVLVNAKVCLREGSYGLECLLCRRGTKEHESILSTDADARTIHLGLVAAGGKPGSPVQFEPKFAPPTGSRIRVLLQYKGPGGKVLTAPAQQWVQNVKTKKPLDEEWVFAGSQLMANPDGDGKPPVYLAGADGALVCTTNVPSAMLDLPINSPKSLENREFAPFTERIPELQTPVVIIFEPAAKKK